MKKQKIILLLFTFIFTIFFNATNAFSEENEKKNEILENLLKGNIKGKIVETTQNKLSIMMGERAVVNLGISNGIIKGDIYGITTNDDVDLKGPIGLCAVQNNYGTTSICEIVKMSKEIQKGNVAFIKKINYTNQDIYNISMDLLNKIVEPYKPYKHLMVSLYTFFDENNNITRFSEELTKGIKNIFIQKQRIKLTDENISRDTLLYPVEYTFTNLVNMAESYMKANNIDVIIGGNYKVVNDKIVIDIYKIDKNYEDTNAQYVIPLKGFNESVAEIIVPYKPIRKTYANANILYIPKYFQPNRDDRYNIIKMESKDDPFIELSFADLNFNIISADSVVFTVDNDTIKFDKNKTAHKLILGKGVHAISASFKRQYYQNNSLVYASENEIKKSIVIIVDKGGELNIEITADPSFFVKDNIIFNVNTLKETEKKILKPVISSSTLKTRDIYKY